MPIRTRDLRRRALKPSVVQHVPYGRAWRRLNSRIAVVRTGSPGKRAFEACAETGGVVASCTFGSNPRDALAAAFTRAARQVKSRAGAFAAFANFSRSRRHRR